MAATIALMLPDYSLPAPQLAELLVGWQLLVKDSCGVRGGIIEETEAYTNDDPASHSYKGKTVRNTPMFMAPGTIYIYKIYGLYHCLNIVCGNYDGQAVLIRSIIPKTGIDIMEQNRPNKPLNILSNGPAKLFMALGIPSKLNGTHITASPLRLLPPSNEYAIKHNTRIGITKATERLWRFTLS